LQRNRKKGCKPVSSFSAIDIPHGAGNGIGAQIREGATEEFFNTSLSPLPMLVFLLTADQRLGQNMGFRLDYSARRSLSGDRERNEDKGCRATADLKGRAAPIQSPDQAAVLQR
jgi:hypothetical protein